MASPLRQTGPDKLPHFTGCYFQASLLSPRSDNHSFQSRYREIHGSGKSSLISALLGEMKTLSGVANTRGKIAYVPQQAKFSIYKLSIKVKFSEKVIKFEKKNLAPILTSLGKKKVGDFFQILWPSHNVLTVQNQLQFISYLWRNKKYFITQYLY